MIEKIVDFAFLLPALTAGGQTLNCSVSPRGRACYLLRLEKRSA